MKYLSLFMKTFDTDQIVQFDDYVLHARKEDGYINAGKLCAMCDKKFYNWFDNRHAQEFLKELELLFKESGIDKPLYTIGRKENRRGTFVHPLVAINIAQWASTKFEVRVVSWIYELFLTGSVDINTTHTISTLDNIRVQQLELENTKLQEYLIKREQEYYNLEVKHERLRDKKTRHKFQTGNCFYILRDIDCKYEVYKFGQTNNFTNRLSTYRTGSPRMTIQRLIYIENHIEFEECVKNYFKENGHLKFANHEYVEIPLDYINNVINTFLQKFDCDIYEIDTSVLNCINKKYLDCISGKQIDQIFNYIQDTSDLNVENISNKLVELEKCADTLKQKAEIINDKLNTFNETNICKILDTVTKVDTKFNEMQKYSERTRQIACDNQPIQKTIQVNRVTTIDNIIIQDFEHEYPLKRRIRKSDFEFLIGQINLKYNRDTHKWFILQFIFHICYYTGIAPRNLISMSREDIVNYINGHPIKINDTYNLLTNDFIKDKFAFLVPYIDNLLRAGMANHYGGKLTYRQLCKWLKLYFDKLEQKNFGKILPKDESYRLYDFKTVLLFRLYNSGMAISDISTFLHHKNICTTQNHLKDHKFLYDETFQFEL